MLHALRHGADMGGAQRLQILQKLRPLQKRHLSQVLQLGPWGQGRQRNALAPAQKLPNGKVLGRIVPIFIERRIVIVAGHRGVVADVLVGPGGEAKIRTTVEHIQAKAGVLLQKEGQLPEHFCGIPGVVLLPPVVKPAAPKLRAHPGSPARKALQGLKGLVRAAAEVHSGPGPLHRTAAQHTGSRPI